MRMDRSSPAAARRGSYAFTTARAGNCSRQFRRNNATLISTRRSLAMRYWLSLSVVAFALPAFAETKTGFVEKSHKNSDGSASPYVVFVPHDYDGKKEVPVILFLHGAGETKGGAKKPAEVGIGPAIRKRDKNFPFLTVIPQSEKRTWQASSYDGKRAIAILDEVMKEDKVDAKRQYLTGLSMGGFGTWSQAAEHPDRWAAIVPICGGTRDKP